MSKQASKTPKTSKTPKVNKSQEVMEKIADTIIKSIESGLAEGKWVKPWVSRDGADMPVNAVTRKHYSGGNVFYLWIMGWSLGYESNEWATYKQWESIDAQVRKGEKGQHVIKWIPKVCKDHSAEERCESCGRLFPSTFVLFNAEQVDNYTPETKEPVETVNSTDRIESVDQFFASLGSSVDERARDMAAYSPTHDRILMPLFSDFYDAAGYYATLAHEHIHWTGAKSRLDRDLTGRFGDDSYAAEELVAELGAAMLCGILGIEEQPRDDHSHYLRHWVRILRDDYKKLWTAASLATKAVEFIESKAKTNELQPV